MSQQSEKCEFAACYPGYPCAPSASRLRHMKSGGYDLKSDAFPAASPDRVIWTLHLVYVCVIRYGRAGRSFTSVHVRSVTVQGWEITEESPLEASPVLLFLLEPLSHPHHRRSFFFYLSTQNTQTSEYNHTVRCCR